jgi:hypothetical protein
MSRATRLDFPLSIGSVHDGGTFHLPVAAPAQTNVFFHVKCLDDLFIKVPSPGGLDEYRHSVKLAQPSSQDVRPLDEDERFERLAPALERFAGFAQFARIEPESAHFLVVHKMQYERLRTAALLEIPVAKFALLQSGRWFGRVQPALFQERVPGTTLWDMFDFDALEIRSEWHQFVPTIADRLRRALDSTLADHLDWNIKNFVFDKTTLRLFYVDMKPSTFVAKHSNAHNLNGIRQYFLA